MKIITTLCATLGLLLSLQTPAFASDKGTPAEAEAMVEKTLAALREHGKEDTYAKVSDPNDTEFHDRDLYVFIITLDGKGTFVAHGAKPVLIGRDLIDLKDTKGSPLVRNFVKMVEDHGEGWVDYVWPNPITKKNEEKSSFVKKFDDDVFVGVGIYK